MNLDVDPALIGQDPQAVIEQLIDQGFKVNVVHARIAKYPEPPVEPVWKLKETVIEELTPEERGGHTVVTILKDDKVVATGKAECSRVDNFNKKLGLTKALGRAIGEMKRS